MPKKTVKSKMKFGKTDPKIYELNDYIITFFGKYNDDLEKIKKIKEDTRDWNTDETVHYDFREFIPTKTRKNVRRGR